MERENTIVGECMTDSPTKHAQKMIEVAKKEAKDAVMVKIAKALETDNSDDVVSAITGMFNFAIAEAVETFPKSTRVIYGRETTLLQQAMLEIGMTRRG